MYINKNQNEDDRSSNSRSSMLDQLHTQLKQQREPDNTDDKVLFGTDTFPDEQSQDKEDVFLPTTGSTCTA